MIVSVSESHRGLSRSSEYHYVVDEGKLNHISYYAISQRRYEDIIEYVVDLNKLRGKEVVEIVVTNSGVLCNAFVYPAEDLLLEYSRRRKKSVPLSYLNSFEFTHLTYDERAFMKTDWRLYYIPMIEELRKIINTLIQDFRLPGFFLENVVDCQLKSEASYPISYLIPYSVNAREKSLEGLSKEIHQVWILARIIQRLSESGRLRSIYYSLKHSSYSAVALFNCRDGLCSLWYEFDMNPHTMCEGLLWNREASELLKEFYERASNILRKRGLERVPLRPDIVVLSKATNCEELMWEFKVRAVIECKNQDFRYWSKDIDTQLIPYKEIFQPEITALISLKKIPDNIKATLNRNGIVVIDEAYPRGGNESELLKLIELL